MTRIRITTSKGPEHPELVQDVEIRDWSILSHGAFEYHPASGPKTVFIPWHCIRRIEVDPPKEEEKK